jgi:hypothetical protein
MPRSRSIFIQSERVRRARPRAFTLPRPSGWRRPPAAGFSVSVVLPASGCEMMAKVRRRGGLGGGAALQRGRRPGARFALLRAGWSNAQICASSKAPPSAPPAPAPCNDARTATRAAAGARRSFAHMGQCRHDGISPAGSGPGRARRAVEESGWRLSQDIDAPLAATLRRASTATNAQRLTLAIAARHAALPRQHAYTASSATPARAGPASRSRCRSACHYGLAAGAAPATACAQRGVDAQRSSVSAAAALKWPCSPFPDTAFRDLVAHRPARKRRTPA